MKKKLLAGAALMLLAGPALAQTGQDVLMWLDGLKPANKAS